MRLLPLILIITPVCLGQTDAHYQTIAGENLSNNDTTLVATNTSSTKLCLNVYAHLYSNLGPYSTSLIDPGCCASTPIKPGELFKISGIQIDKSMWGLAFMAMRTPFAVDSPVTQYFKLRVVASLPAADGSCNAAAPTPLTSGLSIMLNGYYLGPSTPFTSPDLATAAQRCGALQEAFAKDPIRMTSNGTSGICPQPTRLDITDGQYSPLAIYLHQ